MAYASGAQTISPLSQIDGAQTLQRPDAGDGSNPATWGGGEGGMAWPDPATCIQEVGRGTWPGLGICEWGRVAVLIASLPSTKFPDP